MNTFIASDGQFLLNDQPVFIQAGEFHYFRTPHEDWPHRLGLLKEAGFNALATYIPWLWHEMEEGVFDFDGRSHPLRNLAGFLDLAAEMGFWIIPRPGPYIMAETINEGVPPWVFEKYPQVAFISQDGKVQNIASYLHPDFLACASRWYQAIFGILAPRQITRGGKIIMIQLDNEIGMIHWVRNIMDINPDTIARFAIYLEQIYGDELFERYPTADLEKFLKEGIANPTKDQAEKIGADYKSFFRQYFRAYAAFLHAEAQKNGLEVLPVINIHGFSNGGKTFPIGLSQLIEVMSLPGMISATDVYPLVIGEGTFHQLLLVNEMTKALQNKDQALFSIEFQSGGNLDFSNGQSSMQDLHARLCLSTGMRAINHYLFFGGENHPILSPTKRHDWGHPVRTDGTLRKQFYRYPKLSHVLETYGDAWVSAQPETVTTIGFQLDDFMTEVNNEFTREATSVITHQRNDILFDMFARGLALTYRPFTAMEISRAELDPNQIPLLWVMMDKQCNAAAQQKLVDYLNQGGKLVLAGRMCIQDFNQQPCTILKDALGIREIEGGQPWVTVPTQVFGYPDVPTSFVETYTGEWDEVIATREDGGVAGFLKSIGKGQVLVFGAALYVETLSDLDIVNQMALKMGCRSLFTLSDWADVRLSQGDNGSFLFVNNYQDDPVETTIEHRGESLFSGNPIFLPARSGTILPLEWKLNPDVLVHYVTSEIESVRQDGDCLVMRTAQEKFNAELSLSGYSCEGGAQISVAENRQRVRLQGTDGTIILRRNADSFG